MRLVCGHLEGPCLREAQVKRGWLAGWLRRFFFRKLLVSRRALTAAGTSICPKWTAKPRGGN